jgi:hypothetical protein
MQTVKKLGAILIFLISVCLLAVVILYGIALSHRARATAFLREFSQLKLGQSTFDDAQRLSREFKGVPWYRSPGDMRCSSEECDLAFQFDNQPLSYVPFVRYTRFFGLVQIKGGIVVGRELDYEDMSRWDRHYQYAVLDYPGPHASGWQFGIWRLKVDEGDLTGTPHELMIHLDPTSVDDLRARAYSVDLGCLARFWGCGVASAFYPAGIPYSGPPFQGFVPAQ